MKTQLQSMKAKIVSIVVLITIISFGLFTALCVNATRKKVSATVLTKSIENAKQMAEQVRILLDNGADTNQLQSYIEEKATNTDYIAYIVLIDTSVTAVAHSDIEKVGKVYEDSYTIDGAQNGKVMTSKFYADVQKAWTYDIMVPIQTQSGGLYGAFDVGIYEKQVDGIISELVDYQVKLLACVVLAATVLLSVVAILLFKVFNKLIAQCRRISNGNLSQPLEEKLLKRKDEVGLISNSIEDMRKNLNVLVSKSKDEAEKLLEISGEVNTNSKKTQEESVKIYDAMEKVVDGSKEQMQLTSDTALMMQGINKGMEGVAENIQTVTISANSTLDQANKGNEVVKTAVGQMEIISKRVSDTAEQIEILNSKSSEIGEVINFITNIAEQTNLLALNAAIEAARAGEHGKGFAVVADQVRILAEQTSSASSKIITLVDEVQQETQNSILVMKEGTIAVDEGIRLVNEVGTRFQNILSEINSITVEMTDVSAISEEVTSESVNLLAAVEHIQKISNSNTDNTTCVYQNVQVQTKYMEEIMHFADMLSETANELNAAIRAFRL
ncbi:methyl-accepting chemotaxis protein [Anaerosporobacter faecicola]|uniref:methyl-accepting chemotaxis protein n=1 Tax=Anaerosporobacter faecicola TaxID=2718714 RepID=UPI00143A0701|nr:methyl-accepting chemotaxis protein [Anaerosporobacter faecicola]